MDFFILTVDALPRVSCLLEVVDIRVTIMIIYHTLDTVLTPECRFCKIPFFCVFVAHRLGDYQYRNPLSYQTLHTTSDEFCSHNRLWYHKPISLYGLRS